MGPRAQSTVVMDPATVGLARRRPAGTKHGAEKNMQFLENEPPEAAYRDKTQCLNKEQYLENEPPEAACRDKLQG